MSDRPSHAERARHEPDAPPEADRSTLRRAIGASAIGNAVEWFDYGVFAYGAVIISQVLFPQEATGALIFTLLAFAVSFIMRPIGGMVWGPLGDKIGRKKVLAATIMLMAAATFCIGLIPSYAAIGIAAPVLLYLLRMVQGFSTGGEYGGAATFMAEYAPDRKRGFYGSFLEFGTLGGFNGGALLMLTLTWNLSTAQMLDWGWRIPFLIAGPLGLIGLYLRSKMEDTPVFRELEAGTDTTDERVLDKFKDLFTTYLPIMLRLGALVIALNVINYTLLSYMPTYLQTTIDLTDSHALIIPIVGQFAMMAVLPFVGALSDRVGRKPLWIGSLVAFIVLAVPLYHFMAQGFTQAMIAFTILGLLYTPQLATISATFPAMFPAHVRYAGLAMGYNIATSLFGGTAPLVNESLIDATGNTLIPAWYMVGACVVGLVGAVTMIETKGVSVRGTDIPGTGPIPVAAGQERRG